MPSIAEVSTLPQPSGGAAPLVPALKRKRKDEKESESRPRTPVKRQKVAFNPEVNVHLLQDANEKPLVLVQEEVRKAIELHQLGDSIEYDGLKSLLKLKPTSENAPSNSLLRKYILALSGFVHAMGNNCGGLVDALINCQWLRRDEQFLVDFQRLLTTLLSANSGYIPHVLQKDCDESFLSQLKEVFHLKGVIKVDQCAREFDVMVCDFCAKVGFATD